MENCCFLIRRIQKANEHRDEMHGRPYSNLHFALICHQGEPLAARDERNRSDSWALSLCTGCTHCHVAQRTCPQIPLVSYYELISHPGIHPYPKLDVNRVWSDLRVYWEQGELGCDYFPPFSSQVCLFNKQSAQHTLPTAAYH